ncbi:PML protein, partial [Nothoprocta ornata]|nr:PML protein [Nothoprocta pentlandii]NWY05604.1 PML protein [Nothoprocta ornata]
EDEFQSVLCEGCQKELPNLKLLTCLHTLCLNCLSEKKPIRQCPVCQTAIPQASGIPDMDNKLFTNLQARLSIYRKIVSQADLFCDHCNTDAEFWCSECKEFMCTKCFEAHQRYLKKDNHEAKRVAAVKAGSARDFLEGTKKANKFFCSNVAHQNQVLSIYCKKCCKGMCCVCTLLDSKHAGQHCDISLEIQQRQDKLAALSQNLKEKRSSFEVAHKALQAKAACLEQVRSKTREDIRQCVEQLVDLLRREEEMLLTLVETRWEQGCRVLAGELQHLDNVLRRMQASEQLVQKMRLYGSEQEVMDMQPFIKASLEELQRLQPSAAGGLAQPDRHFAECWTRLQAL